MIDWDKPIVRADNNARVWVWGTEGGMVIVQDAKGNKAPFYNDGIPAGHPHRIKNEDAGMVVRTRLAHLMMERARDLANLGAIMESHADEDITHWGSF